MGEKGVGAAGSIQSIIVKIDRIAIHINRRCTRGTAWLLYCVSLSRCACQAVWSRAWQKCNARDRGHRLSWDTIQYDMIRYMMLWNYSRICKILSPWSLLTHACYPSTYETDLIEGFGKSITFKLSSQCEHKWKLIAVWNSF